jgi:hypothetical protein
MNRLAKSILLELTNLEDWPFYICEPRREPEAPKKALPADVVNKIKGNFSIF